MNVRLLHAFFILKYLHIFKLERKNGELTNQRKDSLLTNRLRRE